MAAEVCQHLDAITEVKHAKARRCEECVKIGARWVHLRTCQSCGLTHCCDSSPNRHATAHFHATHHPIIEGYDPPEGWGWCYEDDIVLKLKHRTPQRGPIPRFV